MNAINENTIILALSVAVLAFFMIRWARAHLLRMRAQDWPVAVGSVHSTDLRMERRGGNQSVHVTEVKYGYQVAAEVYQGSWSRQTIFYKKSKTVGR